MLGGGPGSDRLDKIHMNSWQNIFIVAEENIFMLQFTMNVLFQGTRYDCTFISLSIESTSAPIYNECTLPRNSL